MRAITKGGFQGRLTWEKVLYEDDEQRKLAKTTVQRALSRAKEFFRSSNMPPEAKELAGQGTAHLFLQSDLLSAGVCCKQDAFRNEEEERLVFSSSLRSTSAEQRIKHPRLYLPEAFRLDTKTRKGVLVSFLEAEAPRTAIRRIVCGPWFGGGPGYAGREARQALEMFVRYLYEDDQQAPRIDKSDITYRSSGT